MSNTFTGGILPGYPDLNNILPAVPIDPESVSLRIPSGYTVSVRDGENVCVGTALAVGSGAATVSGISGTVSLSDGFVTVKNDYLATPSPSLHPIEKRLSEMSTDELTNALHLMGIPTPAVPSERPVECVIADCCEPDPCSVSVASTLLDRAEAVVGGLRIFMKLTGATRGYLAVPHHMHLCADELSGSTDGKLVKIKSVSDKYPQHEPHMLVSALFNLEINPQTDTGSVGYPVITAEVCAAAFDALAKGIPYTSSYITLSGVGALPSVYSVPFGTDITKLPALCGFNNSENLCTGGNMTKEPVSSGKFTSPGSLTLTVGETSLERAAHECTNCGRCASVCPIRLLPSLIYDCGEIKKAARLGAEYCISCGCCDSVCPAGIALRAAISGMKERIEKEGTA